MLIRMQLFTLMRIRIHESSFHLNADPDAAFHFKADTDPAFHFNADPYPVSHFNADLDPAFNLNADPDPAPHQGHANLRPLAYRPSRSRICKPVQEPRNRFPAWRAGTTTLLVVPARQAT
jgi:hypothetical protein